MPKVEEVQRVVCNYKSANWNKLRLDIAAEAWACLQNVDVNTSTFDFAGRLRELVYHTIPKRVMVDVKGTHPWIDQRLLRLVAARNRALGTPEEQRAIQTCSEEMLAARKDYERRTKIALLEMSPGSKAWWKKSWELLNQKATATTIPALRQNAATPWCLTPVSKAELFAQTFMSKSKLREQATEPLAAPMALHAEQQWQPGQIGVADVAKAFQSLREESATGPDLVASRVLKECSEQLAAPVHALLQRILESGHWPDVWTEHWIVPIHKKKAAGNPGNYRGVHTTSQLSKVVERLILSLLQPFLLDNVVTGPNQFAYSNGRGARDALAYLATSWIRALNGRLKVGVYCSDVSGAFDQVTSLLHIQSAR